MTLFKDMLRSEESVFRDPIPLDFEYMPKVVPFREKEQRMIASCIKPLFQKRSGKNLLVHGKPGVGKTIAAKHLLKELEEETDEVMPVYVNCWQKNSTHKIMIELCNIMNYKFTHNKKTEELFEIIKDYLNKRNVVFVFDEIDKTEELDFLYQILQEIYRKTIILITNHKSWAMNMDKRIQSRLLAEPIEFKPYNEHETIEILRARMHYAFVSGCFDNDAFLALAKKAAQMGDIRTGLYLLKEAGNIAESKSSRKITIEHANEAINNLANFAIRNSETLEDEEKLILEVIKQNSGKKIGELFDIYQQKNGSCVYKTFQRKIAKLEKGRFIAVKKLDGGKEGSTSIINYKSSDTKKLTEF